MNKSRTEFFTDSVIAIAMTLMIVTMAAPGGNTFGDLFAMRWSFIIYLISFFTLAIYWKNHHYIFSGEKRISNIAAWLNIFLILCLTLFPFATQWADLHVLAFAPEMTYGLVLLASNVFFTLLDHKVARDNSTPPAFSARRTAATMIVNLVALALCFFFPPAVLAGRIIVLLLWLLPPKKTW
jgi:uncharacterized membrane protein